MKGPYDSSWSFVPLIGILSLIFLQLFISPTAVLSESIQSPDIDFLDELLSESDTAELLLNLSNCSYEDPFFQMKCSGGRITMINFQQDVMDRPLPTSIGNLTMLTYLQLQMNLTGSIPSEIGYLPSLLHLSLSKNQLEGLIPTSIGNLKLLQSLYLDQNMLSGGLPFELSKLEELGILDVSSNNLSSTPAGLFKNMPKLNTLVLDRNNLSGSLPSFPSSLMALKLSNNNFRGNISMSLFSLPLLQTLEMEFNFFTGVVPSQIVNMPSLTRLVLSSNQLSGTIPRITSPLQIFYSTGNKHCGCLDFSNTSLLMECSVHSPFCNCSPPICNKNGACLPYGCNITSGGNTDCLGPPPCLSVDNLINISKPLFYILVPSVNGITINIQNSTVIIDKNITLNNTVINIGSGFNTLLANMSLTLINVLISVTENVPLITVGQCLVINNLTVDLGSAPIRRYHEVIPMFEGTGCLVMTGVRVIASSTCYTTGKLEEDKEKSGRLLLRVDNDCDMSLQGVIGPVMGVICVMMGIGIVVVVIYNYKKEVKNQKKLIVDNRELVVKL